METCEEAREKGRDENIVVGASYLFRMWVAQRPPGYAFVDFDDSRDADDAIRELDVIDNYKQENITTVNARKARAFRCVLQFPLKSLYCLIIRTVSFYSSSRNKVADP
ncbi:serine/arginine-rich splicing factor RSZ23-like isoform X2 [Malus domestica]|uniref:serine/arginine-rich splicing factor RSZ23-like isoform X2 n=1 Tax=Malus domestica TaxID=3750 RepID=UPI0039752CDA